MKRAVILMVLLAIGIAGYSQNSWTGFTQRVTKSTMMDRGIREGSAGAWQFRYDMGLTIPVLRLEYDENDNMIGFDKHPTTKLVMGLFYTRFNSQAVREWAVGLMFLAPTIAEDRYGMGVAGAYSIFKLGVGYDFGLPLKKGLYLMPGLTIDIFNLGL